MEGRRFGANKIRWLSFEIQEQRMAELLLVRQPAKRTLTIYTEVRTCKLNIVTAISSS
jgi:hypothetical protein